MSLGTAGAILSYALDLEAEAIEFYQRAIEGESNANTKAAFEENHRRHRKIAKTLERMRKENVTEMILEPVHGLDAQDFVIETKDTSNALPASKKIEQSILEYLRVCAEKVAFLPQMKGLLEGLADRIMKNLDTLTDLGTD